MSGESGMTRRLCLRMASALLAAGLPSSVAAASAKLVDIHTVDRTVQVELHYATTANVFHRRLYAGNVALLREPVARRLAEVQAVLRRRGLGLKVWDAYRPRSVQFEMWKLKPGSRYLANSRRGSKHNRGAAVDVTLVDAAGHELRMPTPHDEFTARARRGAVKGVSGVARRNSALLEATMRRAGFRPNPGEWWHFDAPDWRSYPLADVPVPRAGRGVSPP